MKSFNRELPLLAAIEGPKLVPSESVKACESYRDAVRLCWACRRVPGMTQRTAAELSGCYAPHMSGYLSDNEGKRQLPADKIDAFEAVCGNYAITQWKVRQSGLHLAEELMRAA